MGGVLRDDVGLVHSGLELLPLQGLMAGCEMPGFTDALRGYAYPIHRRDSFRCRYCGLDGTSSFGSWLSLSWDHLLPKSDPRRNDPDYIVTACMFCNVADNRYFDLAEKRGLRFEGLTPDELVAQRLPYVEATRQSYRQFWDENVQQSNQPVSGV